jgi:hypothetical protein
MRGSNWTVLIDLANGLGWCAQRPMEFQKIPGSMALRRCGYPSPNFAHMHIHIHVHIHIHIHIKKMMFSILSQPGRADIGSNYPDPVLPGPRISRRNRFFYHPLSPAAVRAHYPVSAANHRKSVLPTLLCAHVRWPPLQSSETPAFSVGLPEVSFPSCTMR